MKRGSDDDDPTRRVKAMVAKLEQQWHGGGSAAPAVGSFSSPAEGAVQEHLDAAGGVGKREVHITCPTNSAGKLIGKGGQMIKALREHSGARIILHDVDPGRDTRVIAISGTDQQVQSAVSAVREVFEEAGVKSGVDVVTPDQTSSSSGAFLRPLPPSLQTEVHLSCPVAAAGQLIGKRGETIRNIRERSGARVILHDIEPGVETRTIGVSGSEHSVQTAVAMIKDTFIAAMASGGCGAPGECGGGSQHSYPVQPYADGGAGLPYAGAAPPYAGAATAQSDPGHSSTIDEKLSRWVLAKRTKDYPMADRLREELKQLGVDAEVARPAWPSAQASSTLAKTGGLTAAFAAHQPSPQTGPKTEFLLSCPTASAGAPCSNQSLRMQSEPRHAIRASACNQSLGL